MAKRVDGNQSEMVAALRCCGLHVLDLHTLGKGAPDILVTGYRRQTDQVEALLVEVKTAKGKLTPDEAEWHSAYPDDGPLLVARSGFDVLRWFGIV